MIGPEQGGDYISNEKTTHIKAAACICWQAQNTDISVAHTFRRERRAGTRPFYMDMVYNPRRNSGGAGFLTGFVGGFTNFILSFIFSVYLVMGKEKICAAAKNVVLAFFSHDSAQRIFYIAGLCNKTFSGFLSGQCLEAVILGVLFVIAMTVFGFPYAVLVGTVIAVTALIPVFGAFVGAGVGIFLIAMEDPIQAVWFLIMFLIIQQIENNLIYPHVVGSSVGLPSLLVFMSVIIGGSLMGVWGMLLFIPSASVLYTLASESVKKRIEKEQTPTDKGLDFSPEKEENRQDNVKENLSPRPAPSRHTEN